eukprot:5217718-Alexandrium_andersonii.AAC.1
MARCGSWWNWVLRSCVLPVVFSPVSCWRRCLVLDCGSDIVSTLKVWTVRLKVRVSGGFMVEVTW